MKADTVDIPLHHPRCETSCTSHAKDRDCCVCDANFQVEIKSWDFGYLDAGRLAVGDRRQRWTRRGHPRSCRTSCLAATTGLVDRGCHSLSCLFAIAYRTVGCKVRSKYGPPAMCLYASVTSKERIPVFCTHAHPLSAKHQNTPS